MALKRLTLCAIVCCVLLGLSAWAQDPSETPNQDGVVLLEGFGQLYGRGLDGSIANDLGGLSLELGFLIGRDLEPIVSPDGPVIGGYAVDGFGGVHEIGAVKPLSELWGSGYTTPLLNWDIIRDLEIVPDWREATNDYQGYLILDGLGGIHVGGSANLPQYPTPDGRMGDGLFPETLLTTQDPLDVLLGGPINETSIARPVFTYFGWDIARDLEISTQCVTVSTALIVSPEFTPASAAEGASPAFATVSTAPQGRLVGMCNGYYILDGFGAVHSCRLPLDFDVNDDGLIDDEDLLSPDFGRPANYRPLVVPWYKGDLPYFGWDIARDIELTPSGNGFYLLDGWGAVHRIGDAHLAFLENPNPTPFFGFDIARALAVVPNISGNGALGYLVLDGFGQVYETGLAEDYDISFTGDDGNPIISFMDSFRDIEITPQFLGATGTAQNSGYVISVAPSDADLSNPNLIYSADVVHTVVPFFEVSTAPYPFFDYVTGL